MWLFFDGGFVSAVCAKKKSGELDTELLMIRARSRKHLERLKERFPEHLKECEIKESPVSDYRFRLIVKKWIFATVAAKLVAEIEYGNFKSRVRQVCGPDVYEHALHRVWGDMLTVQHAEQRQDDQSGRNPDPIPALDQRLDASPPSKRSRRKKGDDDLFAGENDEMDGDR